MRDMCGNSWELHCDGFALTASCGAGDGSDVSVCTDCAAMGMFVSADGASCIASTCPAGETCCCRPSWGHDVQWMRSGHVSEWEFEWVCGVCTQQWGL